MFFQSCGSFSLGQFGGWSFHFDSPTGPTVFDTPWYPSTIWCDVPSPQGLVNGSNASWTIPVLYHPLRIYLWMTSGVLSHFVFFANLPILANPKPHITLEFVGRCTVQPSFPIREKPRVSSLFWFFLMLIDFNRSIYSSSRLDVASYHKTCLRISANCSYPPNRKLHREINGNSGT